jgi:hypothetical protein
MQELRTGFVKMYVKVLRRLGHFNQARWILNNCINSLSRQTQEGASLLVSHDVLDRSNAYDFSFKSTFEKEDYLLSVQALKLLEELHQEYLSLEVSLNDSNLSFIELIKRNLNILQEFQAKEAKRRNPKFRECSERNFMSFPTINIIDTCQIFAGFCELQSWKEIKNRCLKYDLLDYEERGGENRHVISQNNLQSTTAVLTGGLRDFVLKLPNSYGGTPDVDGFLRQIKAVILPPRPLSDFSPLENNELKKENFDFTEEENLEKGNASFEIRNDVFRKRQKFNH